MRTAEAIRLIESSGYVRLRRNGDKLRIEGNSQALTERQLDWLRTHKAEIMAELASVHDMDRRAAKEEAAIRYWRFLHNGVEVSFASGATIAEAYELLRCGSGDDLAPIIEPGEME